MAQEHGVTVEWERMAKTAVIPFDGGVQIFLARTAEDLGLGYVRTMSGAGHDAQEIAAICPTAMDFVRGEYGGISHTPREYASASRPLLSVVLRTYLLDVVESAQIAVEQSGLGACA